MMCINSLKNLFAKNLAMGLGMGMAMTLSAYSQTNFGLIKLGDSSPTATVTVSVTTAGTLGAIAVRTQGAANLDFVAGLGGADRGGSCTVNRLYSAGTTCTANVTFTPKFAGPRAGAVVLTNTGGNVIGTAFMAGTGIGPQVYYPGNAEMTPVVSGGTYFAHNIFMDPNALAVDGKGDIFYGNSGFAPNSVFKLTPNAPGSTTYTASSLDSKLLNPLAVAVDGAGNVYVSSGGYSWTGYPPQVFKYALLPDDSYTPAQPIAVGQFADNTQSVPSGLAIDGSGNLFISDQFAGVVYKAALLPDGTFAPLKQIASGLGKAWGAAVDGSGNVYVATGPPGVAKLTARPDGTYSVTAINSTAWVNGLAVDSIGNVYLAGYIQPRELVLQSNGSYREKTLNPGGGLNSLSVAVDASGNVFIGDGNTGNVVEEPYGRQPLSLSFASTAVGSTSSDSPKTLTLGNNGNTPLVFADIAYPVDFPEHLGVPGDCPIGTPLAPSASCTLSINFQPSVSGLVTDSFVISDNALNGQYTEQTISLNGTGTGTTRADAWWNPFAQITYGANLSNVLNATSSVPGKFVYSTNKGVSINPATILPAGNWILEANFTAKTGRATFHRVLQLKVLQAPLLVMPTSMTLTYMSQIQRYTYTVSGLINGDTQATAVTGTPTINANGTVPVLAGYICGQVFIMAPVGTYPLKSAWGSMKSSNYALQFGTGTLTIVPTTKALTITARNVTVAKGAKFPTSFSYTKTGMLGMDSASTAGKGVPIVRTTATAKSARGTYPITVSAGTFAAPNYSGVNYVNGTLTIQ